MTTTVYRLERSDGTGPYGIMGAVEDTNDSAHRPRTHDDDLPYIYALSHMHFGFADLDALHAWFDDEALALMADHDVNLTTYDVRVGYIMRGGKQLCFSKDHATLTKVLPIEVET